MLLADDVGAEDLGEQVEFGLAGRWRTGRDIEDRAVVLLETDRSIVFEPGIGEVALLALDDCELQDTIDQWRAVDLVPGHPLADPNAELAPPSREYLFEQILATDRLDGRQEARGKGVVVRGEEFLGGRRDVVQVPWATDAVADGLATDQLGCFERAQLLEHPGPARADPLSQLVRRTGPVEAQAQEEVATQVRWCTRHSLGEPVRDDLPGPAVGSGG